MRGPGVSDPAIYPTSLDFPCWIGKSVIGY